MMHARPPYLSLLLLLTAGLAGCATNPTGGTDFVLMGERGELRKGNEMHEELLANTPVYSDPKLQAYIESVGARLVANSHRDDIEYTFTVIDSPDINAFALPGHVYINRGILNYLTSEDELAAVLGHEIGHITGRHSVRQDAAGKTSNIISGVVGVASTLATGVNLGELSSIYGGALVSGYGRDMELEADELGAEYLYNTGYDPQAMVRVIGVLKNQEDFQKKIGQQGPAYHGLFSSHPRNDVRLNQAVSKSGELANDLRLEIDPQHFRNALEGLPVGPTLQTVATQDRNRYYQTLLNYTMIFADDWTWTETPTTVTASSPAGDAQLKVEVQRRTSATDARTFIRETLGISELQQTEDIRQYGLSGHTGIIPDTGQRLAVIHYGPRAFIFTGVQSTAEDKDASNAILSAIASFRPVNRNEQRIVNPPSIRYVQVGAGTTYAQLARNSVLGQYAEDQLRLMNGDYPSGEPQAGEWVKIVE